MEQVQIYQITQKSSSKELKSIIKAKEIGLNNFYKLNTSVSNIFHVIMEDSREA